jgi:hypothetical protein
MWHLYDDLTRNWSALDRDCAANTCHDIEWDDRRWNGCASSSLSYGAAHPLPRLSKIGVEAHRFMQVSSANREIDAHHVSPEEAGTIFSLAQPKLAA